MKPPSQASRPRCIPEGQTTVNPSLLQHKTQTMDPEQFIPDLGHAGYDTITKYVKLI